jgi:predicted nucleotidyltransferase component of viral defense system
LKLENELKFNFLTENASGILNKLSLINDISDYTFVGGSALAILVGHRISEDLDFMFSGSSLDRRKIERILKNITNEFELLKQEGDEQLDYIMNNTKITFFTSGAVNLDLDIKPFTIKYKNLTIANTLLIALLKINAITYRNTIKDYYDIFYISKYYHPLNEIISECKKNLPNIPEITYNETLIYTDDITDDISDLIKPKELVSKNEIAEYFKTQIKEQ